MRNLFIVCFVAQFSTTLNAQRYIKLSPFLGLEAGFSKTVKNPGDPNFRQRHVDEVPSWGLFAEYPIKKVNVLFGISRGAASYFYGTSVSFARHKNIVESWSTADYPKINAGVGLQLSKPRQQNSYKQFPKKLNSIFNMSGGIGWDIFKKTNEYLNAGRLIGGGPMPNGNEITILQDTSILKNRSGFSLWIRMSWQLKVGRKDRLEISAVFNKGFTTLYNSYVDYYRKENGVSANYKAVFASKGTCIALNIAYPFKIKI